MREIKFRFFAHGKMLYDWELLTHKEWGIQTINNVLSANTFKMELVKIMQYTGLTDKNGKEIYEGDIVKDLAVLPEDEERDYISVVEFKWGSFLIYDKEKEKYNTVAHSTLEVIGNIYENPELLKEGRAYE